MITDHFLAEAGSNLTDAVKIILCGKTIIQTERVMYSLKKNVSSHISDIFLCVGGLTGESIRNCNHRQQTAAVKLST